MKENVRIGLTDYGRAARLYAQTVRDCLGGEQIREDCLEYPV